MSNRDVQAKAANIFLNAATYIRQYGWQKEGMGKHGQPRCSMGALASAYPRRQWNKNLASLMYLTLYEELDGLSLTQYNHTYKNGEKVARLYERVAEKLQHHNNLHSEIG